jgi:hypothetical protein
MENSPSPIKSSDPVTLSTARDRSADLRRITEAMLMPIGYELGIGHLCPRDIWDLCVVHADPGGETDFDQPIVTGSREDVDTAISTLASVLDARRAVSDHHSGPLPETPDDPADAKPFRSRFENIERPTLLLEHDPGWTCIDAGDPVGNSHFVFQTHNEEFGLDFSVLEDDTHEPSIGMTPSNWDWNVETAEELLKLSDHTPRLQEWLDDCGTVTDWIRKHEGEADHE